LALVFKEKKKTCFFRTLVKNLDKNKKN